MYVLCLPPQACALPFSPPTGGHAQGQRGTGPWVVAAEGSGGGGWWLWAAGRRHSGWDWFPGLSCSGPGNHPERALSSPSSGRRAAAPEPLLAPSGHRGHLSDMEEPAVDVCNSPLLCPVLFTQSFLGKAAMVWAQRGQCGPRSCLWGYWFSAGY